jgi:hypothetical protein
LIGNLGVSLSITSHPFWSILFSQRYTEGGMISIRLICVFLGLGFGSACLGETSYVLSKPGKLLLKENFDQPELPKLFTVGTGDWTIVDGVLRGRELAQSKHTAFRKIFLDHYNVIYEYDMKLEGDGFHRLLINWDLAHIAKAEIHYDKAEVVKITEKGKRKQMKAGGRDNGLDPLKGNYDEPTSVLKAAPLHLEEGKWYHVVIELVDDQLSLQIDGQTVVGKHIGLTEKKDNFGFQTGGLAAYVFIDNVRVHEAIALGR